MRKILKQKHNAIPRTVLVLLAFAVTAGAAFAGECVSAGIDEPVLFPDGALHEAGTLRLCLDRDYSPVASLHTASIGGADLGLLTSRRGTSEGAVEQPFMMFVRDANGILHLYGYAIPAGSDGRMNTYFLQPPVRRDATLRVAVATASLTAGRVPAGAP